MVAELDANSAYEYLLGKITRQLDRFAPKKIVTLRACDKFHVPWLSVKFHKYNTKCRKLCDKARRTQSDCDIKRYRSFRNVLN